MGARAVSKYSQRFVDVLNLETNAFETHPVSKVLSSDYPGLPLLASVNKGDYVQSLFSVLEEPDPNSLVLTFDNLIAKTKFVALIKFLLQTVEQHYGRPVDMEFAVRQVGGRANPELELSLLQCRPLSIRAGGGAIQIPNDVPAGDTLFTANRLVPQGLVSKIRYAVWVDPVKYDQIPDPATKTQIARVIGQINWALEGERFVLMGPGRWGSSNLNLGVKVSYADIDNASVLIEIALAQGDHAPEASYGTHFFQDLVEAQIYPLPLYPDDADTVFNWNFFRSAENALGRITPDCADYERYIKVIDLPAATRGRHLEIAMNGDAEQAIGYLK